jgi:hypothetical protein
VISYGEVQSQDVKRGGGQREVSCQGLKYLDAEVDINSAWEIIRERV